MDEFAGLVFCDGYSGLERIYQNFANLQNDFFLQLVGKLLAFVPHFSYFGTPLPCGRVPSEGTARQCQAFWQGFSPKKNYSSRYYFLVP